MACPAQRKPVGSSKLPQEITDARYCATPHSFFKRLFRCLEPVEYCVLGNILDETVGAVHYQSHARISHKQFADWAGVTPDAIDKALRSLKEKKLITTIKLADRSVKYHAIVQNFDKVAERPPLKKPRVDEEQEPEAGQRSAPVVLAPQAPPFRVNLGRTAAYFSNKGTEPLEIEQSESDGKFYFLIGFSKTDNTAVLSNRPAVSEREFSQPLAQFDPLEELRAALTPWFQRLFRSLPDFGMLSDTAHALRDTPVPYYMERVRIKADTGYKIKPGLFKNLAEDAAASWKELSADERIQWISAHAPADLRPRKPFKETWEPEDSDSIWSRIRRFLKGVLPANIYSAFFAPTAQIVEHHGKLRIEVPDQVTVDALEKEYGQQISDAIRELGLEVTQVEYTVPFEEEAR